RGAETAQEQQDDQHHEGDGERERELDVVHGGANGRGAVENGFHLDGGWNSGGELRQLRLNLIDRVDDVGAGLLENGQDDAAVVVLIGSNGAVERLRSPPAGGPDPYPRAPCVG